MDRIVDLATIVQQEVEDYARGTWYKTRTYPISDTHRQTYALIAVPENDYPLDVNTQVILLTYIARDQVVIEQDITDKPLWEELVRAGIPREQIVCRYAGETLSIEDTTH